MKTTITTLLTAIGVSGLLLSAAAQPDNGGPPNNNAAAADHTHMDDFYDVTYTGGK